jgi:NAD+ synthase (glutamine-hydrolysing)
VKVAAVTPNVRVADVDYNKEQIFKCLDEALLEKAKVIVFPELCVTGYTCGDLFAQNALIQKAEEALEDIVAYTIDKDALVFVGLPYRACNKLYNVAAAICDGELLGLVTKSYLPNYGEAYEMRQFQPGPKTAGWIAYGEDEIPFGPQLLFSCDEMPDLVVSAEICEDVWAPMPPSVKAALAGATLIVNCSASPEAVGKDAYRQKLIQGQSARIIAGYVYANAGEGESTTDLVFGGHNVIAENEKVLKESKRFVNETIYSEIDIQKIVAERQKNTTFQVLDDADEFIEIPFSKIVVFLRPESNSAILDFANIAQEPFSIKANVLF